MNFTLEEKNHLKDIHIFFIEDKKVLNKLSSKEEGIEFNVAVSKNNFKIKLCTCGCVTVSVYTRLSNYYYEECPICQNNKFKRITTVLNKTNDYSLNLHDNYKFVKKSETLIIGEKIIFKLKVNIKVNNGKVDELSFELLEGKTTNNKVSIYMEGNNPSDFYVVHGKNKKINLNNYMSNFWTDDIVLSFLEVYNEIFKKTDLYIPIIPRIEKHTYIRMLTNYEMKIINEYFNTDTYQLPSLKTKSALKNININHETKRNVQTILGVPKSVLKEILKYSDKVVTLHTKNTIINSCLDIAETFKDLPPENIIKLIQLYRNNRGMSINFVREMSYLLDNGHKFNQLIYYLYNAKEKQNILYMGNVINYYYDYVRMSNEILVPYTKYPKNLVKVHDIRAKDFEALLTNKKDEKFINVYKEYSYLNKENIVDNYIFVYPENINDLIFEGQKLNHCVSSYASLVINKKSIIFFMRKKTSKKQPLITIEIDLETKKVVQVRGNYNRRLTNEENIILNKWIKSNLE